jgi:Dullard-like phosphatase family protein
MGDENKRNKKSHLQSLSLQAAKIEEKYKQRRPVASPLRKRIKFFPPQQNESNEPKSPKLKVPIDVFEKRFSETDPVYYIESTQNTPGNYSNYVSSVLKNLKNFDEIDYRPAIINKYTYLDRTSDRKSLFLDLDETLVHSDFCHFYKKHDVYLDFKFESQNVTVPVLLRPGLYEFLDYCSSVFDVYIFTASRKEYADCIIDHIEKNKKYFCQRFYRENCIVIKNRVFIKDLRMFVNADLKDMLIVDNSLFSFANQLANGVLITSFYDDQNDKELLNVKNYLQNMKIANVEDVRTVNRKIFNFELIKEKI